ncbi:solute carrier family 40 member 1-like [Dendronephthya gigantea]|uniref:solute carrier family 40 member 1-like n=1 Tax=Dendronephthya gigantea TaxID=151771 RepID=UPI00106BC6A7|nr:solute carrier family 40 member 1-like [Dendronephthya gigantea]
MDKHVVNSPLLDEEDSNESFNESESLNTHGKDESQNVNSRQSREQTAEDEVNEDHEQEFHTNKKGSIFERCGCSPTIMICVSHALSAWGDRMWMYAISIFLIALTPGSFLFTAIYGLAVSLSVVAFGTLVGDWIDVTPRLKAARLTLIIQNAAVVACAVVILIMFKQSISSPIFFILAVFLVLLAIVARLSSLGTTIAIERDWVVVIVKEDESLLAGTNSILRRIDLTCNILAPVSTGLIIDYGSKAIGVLFIAGWNIVSLFVEYTLLSSVYRSCPALAKKTVDVSRLEDNDFETDENLVNVDLSENDEDGTILVPRVKTSLGFKMHCNLLVDKVKRRARIIRFGLKLFFQQRVAFAGIGLACLYLTVLGFDSITTAYAYSQHVSALALGILTGAGALTGILGTFIFPQLRKMFGLVKTGMISNSVQLFFLMFCVAAVWAPGHPGHLLDPNYHDDTISRNGEIILRNRSVLSTKSLVSSISVTPSLFDAQSSLILRPTVTKHQNSSFSSNYSVFISSKSINPSSSIPLSLITSIPAAFNATNTGNDTKGDTKRSHNHKDSNFISLGLLMGGIVMSRIGLWMTDLVITQLFQENVAEQERGIVSGVQNSFNSIMDVVHFVMVTVAPKPEDFGALILISVGMVSLGLAFYSRFAWNHRKRLKHLEKLSHWSASNESIEGTSRRLTDDSRSNSKSDISSGILTVTNDNYSTLES